MPITGDRLHINLLLVAYDENIVEKLKCGKDNVFAANYLVKLLNNTYGFDYNLCVWSVLTWLIILKLDDDAIAFFDMQTLREHNNNVPNSQHKNTKQECVITELIPNCLSNRRIFQSSLSDILANDKLHINLLLAAYDENIVEKLK